jgi:hypothetical protein
MRHALAATVLAASLSGCYSPNITSGQLHCTTDRKCPDGFRCQPDLTCWRPADLMCAAPPVTSLCDEGANGNPCNPICQTQCNCGRCSFDGTALKCTPPGTKEIGDICTPGGDDCDTGLVCLGEGCGGIGRCYQFCSWTSGTTTRVCPSSSGGCNTTVNDSNGNQTNYTVCDQPPATCDPVKGTGCANAALACYANGDTTFCECKGSKQLGQMCNSTSDCQPGYTCLSTGAGAQAMCFKACAKAADCTSPQTCIKITVAGVYGYCG